jgi:hypothetical protein
MSNYEQIWHVIKVTEKNTTLKDDINYTELVIEYQDYNKRPMRKVITLYPNRCHEKDHSDVTIDNLKVIEYHDETGIKLRKRIVGVV